MRKRLHHTILLLCILLSRPAGLMAQPQNEAGLVMQVLSALVNKDAIGYAKLFPDIDLISAEVLRHADTANQVYQSMLYLRDHPDEMPAYDRVLDSALMSIFNNLIDESKKLNIHWAHVMLARYELEQQKQTRDVLYEKIAPERFLGYVFIRDPVDNATYCFTVGDLMKVQGKWYGGTLTHIFEAQTKFDFEQQLARYKLAKKKGKDFVWKKIERSADEDTTAEKESEQERAPGSPTPTIVERKYYTGTFDDEIPVQLYVRYLKGNCPEGVCSYDALFKFGDQDEYVRMTAVKNAEGKWIFTESPGNGVMDLTLKDGQYTGSWTSTTDQTGYEAKLKEAVPGNKKLQFLDELFELELWKK